MPDYLKVLVIVLSAGAIVFWAGEKIFCPKLVDLGDFRLRRNAWFGVVLVTFLSHDFWIATLLTGCLTFLFARRDPNPLAVYMTVLFAVPWYSMKIPGLGLVNYFLELNHFKMINLSILLAFLLSRPLSSPPGSIVRYADWAMVAYLIYTNIMLISGRTATSIMRELFDDFLMILLPYLAFSRMSINRMNLSEIFVALLLCASISGLLAPFETFKEWLLFGSLRGPLDIPPPEIRANIFRGETGLLRAMGTFDHSIILGYVMMICIISALSIRAELEGSVKRTVFIIPLIMGLIFSLSRGPWVGCVIGIIAYFVAIRGSLPTLAYLFGTCLFFALMLQFAPNLQGLLDFLPFIGAVDSVTVSYRVRLLEVGLELFFQNPVFGTLGYIANPIMEEMRQGQGIIDIVNTYLALALAFGGIGLILFIIPFLIGIFSVVRGIKRAASPQVRRLNGGILATLIGILVTIATVSSIGAVAPLYWILVGIAVRFGSADFSMLNEVTSEKHIHLRSFGN